MNLNENPIYEQNKASIVVMPKHLPHLLESLSNLSEALKNVIIELSTLYSSEKAQKEDRLLTIPQAAKETHKSPSAIYDWIRQKDHPLPAFNVSTHPTDPRGWRVYESVLKGWLIEEYGSMQEVGRKNRVKKLIEI